MNYKIVIILIEHSECFHCLQYLPEARRVDSHPWRGKSCWLMPPQVKKILWKLLFPHCPPNPRASWLLSYRNLNRSTMEFLLRFIVELGLLTFSFLSIDFDFLLHLHCRWIKWQCKSCKLQPAKQWNSGGTLRQKFNLIDIWHLTFDIWHLTYEHLNIWTF